MTRIVAGTFGGRRIEAPKGGGTRPTSERVREAIFSRLDHLDVLDGAHVVDLYAGSGALALEAMSRGARSALLVESHAGAASVASANVAALGARDVRVVRQPVEKAVSMPPSQPADVVLIDPPYDLSDLTLAEVLSDLVAHDWLVPGGVVVVERSSRSPEPVWPPSLEPLGDKRYGETVVWYAERACVAPGPATPAPVALAAVDEDVLAQLVAVAVADADAAEVTPFAMWDDAARTWFTEYHRRCRGEGPEHTWAIVLDGTPAGAVRLQQDDSQGGPGTLVTGIWLARGARGRGVSARAMTLVVDEARSRGARRVVADTARTNEPARALMRSLGFSLQPDGDRVHGVVNL